MFNFLHSKSFSNELLDKCSLHVVILIHTTGNKQCLLISYRHCLSFQAYHGYQLLLLRSVPLITNVRVFSDTY